MADRAVEYLIRIGLDPAAAAKAAESVKTIKSEVASLDAQATRTGQNLTKAASALSGAGRAGVTAGRAGEALNGLGLSGPGSALQGFGDLGKAASDLAKLKEEFVSTATAFGSGVKDLPGVLGAAATQGSAVATALGAGGLTAALAGVAAIALPLTIAVGAIAAAFKVFIGDTIAKGDDDIKKALVSVDAYYAAIVTGDTEAIQSQIKRLELQKRISQQEYDLIAAQRDELGKSLGAASDKDAGFNALNDRANALKKTLSDTTSQVDGLNRALKSTEVAAADAAKIAASNASLDLRRIQIQANAATAALSQADQTSDALERTAAKNKAQLAIIQGEIDAIFKSPAGNTVAGEQAIQRLADEQARLALETDNITKVTLPLVSRLEDLKKATEDYAKASADLIALEKDHTKALEDRARSDIRSAVEAGYQARIQLAKNAEQMQEDQKARDAILHEQNVREEDALKSYRKSQLDADKKFHDSETALGKSYMDSQLAALQAYQRAEQQANDRYAKDRLRSIEDLGDKLLDDVANNDAASFLTDQKAGIKALQRQSEDHDDEAKLRLQAFSDQQKAAEKQYTDQLHALQDQYGKENRERDQQYRDEIAQIQAQGRAKLEEDRIAHQNRVTQSQQLQNELDALKDQWTREDEARRRQIEDESYQEREKALNDQLEKDRGYWAAASSLVGTYWSDAQTIAQTTINNLRSMFGVNGGTPAPTDTTANHPATKQFLKEFGNGGQIFAGQAAIVGDRGRPEVFFPGQSGQIVPMERLGGGVTVNVGDITIGAGNAVTRDEVQSVLDDLPRQFVALLPGYTGRSGG